MRSEFITVNALYRSARSCINTRPMGSCLYQINSSGCALGFICNRAERYRRYLSYKHQRDSLLTGNPGKQLALFLCCFPLNPIIPVHFSRCKNNPGKTLSM